MMLDLKSAATSWPISPERSTLARALRQAAPANRRSHPGSRCRRPVPSSVTPAQRVLGVHSDFMNGAVDAGQQEQLRRSPLQRVEVGRS
jgi:hypothetical protein